MTNLVRLACANAPVPLTGAAHATQQGLNTVTYRGYPYFILSGKASINVTNVLKVVHQLKEGE